MSGRRKMVRVAVCSLCRRNVFRPAGPDGEPVEGPPLVRNVKGKVRQVHAHQKPFELQPCGPLPVRAGRRVRDGADDQGYRYWHDQAPWFVR